MSPHRDAILLRASELLKDGKWHHYESLVKKLVRLVPPAIAIRQCETERSYDRGRTVTAPAERVRPLKVDDQIRIGARSIVRKALGMQAFECRVLSFKSGRKRRDIRMLTVPRRARLARQYQAEAAEAQRKLRRRARRVSVTLKEDE